MSGLKAPREFIHTNWTGRGRDDRFDYVQL
jgi:hypothetical protein